MQTVLDKEWVNLMLIAKEMGITKEQVRDFINEHKNMEKVSERGQ